MKGNPAIYSPNAHIAGEAITAGNPVAQDPDDNLWYNAIATDADLCKVRGIAENSAAEGQPIHIVRRDPQFKPGATLTVGHPVMLAATAGQLAATTDVVSGWYPQVLGMPVDTEYMNLNIVRSDSVVP